MSSISEHSVVKNVLAFFCEAEVKEGASILIGLSGGPDSISLLSVLSVLEKKWGGHLGCCYVDHGIRKRSEREADLSLVSRMAERFAVPLYTKTIEPGMIAKIAAKEHRSGEEIARTLRYQYLQETALEMGFDYIAVGHHQDDNLETIVMRFFQGSGLQGLSGIAPQRDTIIRPLINCKKDEILDYIRKNNLDYRIDVTNQTTFYLRNKVRLQLMPLISTIFPGYRSSLLSFAEKMASAEALVENEVSSRIHWNVLPNGFTTDWSTFLYQPEIIRIEALFTLYNRHFQQHSSFRLPYRFLRQLAKFDVGDSNGVLLRGYGMVIERKGNVLFIGNDVDRKLERGFYVTVDRQGTYAIIENLYLHVEKKVVSFTGSDEIILPEVRISFPILVRSRRTGDRIILNSGTKSVKKLLNEWKVPPSLRWKFPIIQNREGISAVCGKPFGYKNRVAQHCKKCDINATSIVLRFSYNKHGVED